MKKYIFILLLLATLQLHSQEKINADKVINSLVEKMDAVKGYTVDLNIKIDVDFINIKERNAKLTYESPDKFDIESKDFVMLPESGAKMEHLKLLRSENTAIYLGEEKLNKKTLSKIKVIPNEAAGDIVLATFWIDVKNLRINKIEAYTEEAGSYELNFEYADHPHDLPNRLTIEFDLKNFQVPAQMSGEFSSFGDMDKDKETKGKVIINYSNYKVKK